MQLLSSFRFNGKSDAWPKMEKHEDSIRFVGAGVHTRIGDAIELTFTSPASDQGSLRFGFFGGNEFAIAKLNFANQTVSLYTSDWRLYQPVASLDFSLEEQTEHVLRMERLEGGGKLVKLSRITLILDGKPILQVPEIDIVPEIGVKVEVQDAELKLLEFRHIGRPSGIPEYFKVGGWQMPNDPNIENNLNSIFRGLQEAAEAGIRLLVTPESSLTGLYPDGVSNSDPALVQEAEAKLREFISNLPNAPYLIAGLPVWEADPARCHKPVRYNLSRVYAPDGAIEASCRKVHAIESEYWHGYNLNEVTIEGVPITMHICHDSRYPETWTLPVMFGARLIVNPTNPSRGDMSVHAFEKMASDAPKTSHSFYLRVDATGRSFITCPEKGKKLLAVSAESRRDNPSFPMVGKVQESLFWSNIRVHDAFGYWPVRSFRASERTAEAYVALYQSRGGSRFEVGDKPELFIGK